MAIVSIGTRRDLTVDQVWSVFARHFGGKYDVVPSNAHRRDFIVKKNAWAGVGVRLKQERTGTSFIFTGLIPNMTQQLLFGGMASYFFLRSDWKDMEAEIADFIQNEPSFQRPNDPAMEQLAA
jgi:hypothetical protein